VTRRANGWACGITLNSFPPIANRVIAKASRVVRRTGISLPFDSLPVDALAAWIGTPKMEIRYDRGSESHLLGYADGDSTSYVPELRRPPISLSEHQLALQHLRKAKRVDVDEEAIFQTVKNMRESASEARLGAKKQDAFMPRAAAHSRRPWSLVPIRRWQKSRGPRRDQVTRASAAGGGGSRRRNGFETSISTPGSDDARHCVEVPSRASAHPERSWISYPRAEELSRMRGIAELSQAHPMAELLVVGRQTMARRHHERFRRTHPRLNPANTRWHRPMFGAEGEMPAGPDERRVLGDLDASIPACLPTA